MEVVHKRCVGMDISKTDAKVCVRIARSGRQRADTQITTTGATSAEILALAEELAARQVTCVVMEATGDYWKPFYYLMEASGLPVMLVDPKQARQIPGRKTDVNDAVWLADLAAHGLVKASFVPPPQIRELKDLVRTRTTLSRLRAEEVQRLEKLLESAAIKLSCVISNIVGLSGRRMLDALIAGERNPAKIAALGDGRLKATRQSIAESVTGRFTDHHGFLARIHLDLVDEYTGRIEEISARIDDRFSSSGDTPPTTSTLGLAQARDLLTTIPGVSTTAAEQILAEIGINMCVFPTSGHLASWAGVAPGANESAGKIKSSRCRPGDTYLKGVLGICAMSIIRADNTFLAARFKRIMARRGRSIALVAIMRSLLETIWHILTTQQPYHDLGTDYYTRRKPGQAINNALQRLREAGCTITTTNQGLLIAQT